MYLLPRTVAACAGDAERCERILGHCVVTACSCDHIDVLRVLVEQGGCDPNAMNPQGALPLAAAAEAGALRVLEYLVHTCFVDVEAVSASGTALVCAASVGALAACKLLVAAGASTTGT